MAQSTHPHYASYSPFSESGVHSELDSSEINKCISQIKRKREYNRRYYQNKVKPQKEQEKKELQLLRKRCAQLEQNHQGEQVNYLMHQVQDLTDRLRQLEQENASLKEALEVSRQRNYELLINNAQQYLPNIEGMTLNQ